MQPGLSIIYSCDKFLLIVTTITWDKINDVCREIEYFSVKIGVHQGTAFLNLLEEIIKYIQCEVPCCMLFEMLTRENPEKVNESQLMKINA